MSPPPERDGFTVLVVEDEAADQWLMAEILRARGHSVVACSDAETAWASFESDPQPLVLLDLLLPGANGLDLCRRIRAAPGGEDPVILVVTGHREPDVLEAVLAAGADDYVSKPVDVPHLNIRLAVAERDVRLRNERRGARDALAHKTRELETLFENLDQVFFSIDPRGERLIQVSRAAEAVLGRTPAEIMEDPALWRELLYPPDLEARQGAGAGDGPERSLVLQYPVRLPDGAERWVESRVNAALDEDGRALRLDGMLSDMTDRRRAQQELAARNQELMSLYRVSEITLTARSLEGAYDEILQEIANATGFPVVYLEHHDAERARLVVVAARGFALPDPEEGRLELPVHETLSGIAARTGRPVVERDVRTRPGELPGFLHHLDLRTYLSCPMLVGHEVVGTLTLAHTEPVEPDRRLVRWTGSLATSIASFVDRMVAEEARRESELEHRALAVELRRTNQELESFAYSVSHDLRAPLRTMQGFAHTLLQNFGDRLDEEARDYVGRIIRSGQKSEELIADLLAYSRLSYGEVELQPVALDGVVAAAREQVIGDLNETDARLTVDAPLPVVEGHHPTLVQVVANLLSNAVKFVPDGTTPEIRVRAETGDVGTTLWVEDNGIGIPPNRRERVFRVFERLEGSVRRSGTGIGLAVVRRGMEKMGGLAGVEGREGGGSAFWIRIPRSPGRGWRPWIGRRRDPGEPPAGSPDPDP